VKNGEFSLALARQQAPKPHHHSFVITATGLAGEPMTGSAGAAAFQICC
jgi:hypothetical protein